MREFKRNEDNRPSIRDNIDALNIDLPRGGYEDFVIIGDQSSFTMNMLPYKMRSVPSRFYKSTPNLLSWVQNEDIVPYKGKRNSLNYDNSIGDAGDEISSFKDNNSYIGKGEKRSELRKYKKVIPDFRKRTFNLYSDEGNNTNYFNERMNKNIRNFGENINDYNDYEGNHRGKRDERDNLNISNKENMYNGSDKNDEIRTLNTKNRNHLQNKSKMNSEIKPQKSISKTLNKEKLKSENISKQKVNFSIIDDEEIIGKHSKKINKTNSRKTSNKVSNQKLTNNNNSTTNNKKYNHTTNNNRNYNPTTSINNTNKAASMFSTRGDVGRYLSEIHQKDVDRHKKQLEHEERELLRRRGRRDGDNVVDNDVVRDYEGGENDVVGKNIDRQLTTNNLEQPSQQPQFQHQTNQQQQNYSENQEHNYQPEYQPQQLQPQLQQQLQQQQHSQQHHLSKQQPQTEYQREFVWKRSDFSSNKLDHEVPKVSLSMTWPNTHYGISEYSEKYKNFLNNTYSVNNNINNHNKSNIIENNQSNFGHSNENDVNSDDYLTQRTHDNYIQQPQQNLQLQHNENYTLKQHNNSNTSQQQQNTTINNTTLQQRSNTLQRCKQLLDKLKNTNNFKTEYQLKYRPPSQYHCVKGVWYNDDEEDKIINNDIDNNINKNDREYNNNNNNFNNRNNNDENDNNNDENDNNNDDDYSKDRIGMKNQLSSMDIKSGFANNYNKEEDNKGREIDLKVEDLEGHGRYDDDDGGGNNDDNGGKDNHNDGENVDENNGGVDDGGGFKDNPINNEYNENLRHNSHNDNADNYELNKEGYDKNVTFHNESSNTNKFNNNIDNYENKNTYVNDNTYTNNSNNNNPNNNHNTTYNNNANNTYNNTQVDEWIRQVAELRKRANELRFMNSSGAFCRNHLGQIHSNQLHCWEEKGVDGVEGRVDNIGGVSKGFSGENGDLGVGIKGYNKDGGGDVYGSYSKKAAGLPALCICNDSALGRNAGYVVKGGWRGCSCGSDPVDNYGYNHAYDYKNDNAGDYVNNIGRVEN